MDRVRGRERLWLLAEPARGAQRLWRQQRDSVRGVESVPHTLTSCMARCSPTPMAVKKPGVGEGESKNLKKPGLKSSLHYLLV